MKKHFTYVVIALVLLTAALGAYATWYLTVRTAANRSFALASEVEQAVEAVAQAAETRDVLISLAADEAAINAHFIVVSDIALFLEELEATGRGLGSSVEVVSVADKPTNEGRLTVTLRIRGAYDSVLRTVGALEYGPHDTRLDTITLDVSKESEAGGWTATAALSVGIVSSAAIAPK